MTLKCGKCQLKMTEFGFISRTLSARRIGTPDVKVKTVNDVREPKNAAKVRSIIGLVNITEYFFSWQQYLHLSDNIPPLKRSLWNIQITHGLLFSLRTKNGKQFVSGLSRSIWRGTELNIGKPHFNSHRPKEKLKGKTAVSKWGTYVLSKPRVQLKSRDRHLQINRSQYTAYNNLG